MTKKTSKIKTAALKFFSIPLLVAVMLVFSEKVSAQIEPGKGVSKELFRQYKKQVRKATVKVKNEDGTKTKKVDTSKLDKELMNEIYAQMSPEQKIKVEPLPKSENGIVLNLEDLNLDEISKLGIDIGDLGIQIAGDVLSDLDLRKLDNLNVEYFNSPEWKDHIEKIEKNAAETEAYFNSPEYKKKIADMEKKGAELEAYYNSPEYKKKIANIEKKAAELEAKYNSPEWKKKIADMEKKAAELEAKYNSPEWKKKVKEMEEKAENQF